MKLGKFNLNLLLTARRRAVGGRVGGDLCAKEGQSVRGEFTHLQVNAHSVLCSLLTVLGGVGGLLIFCTESNHNMILRKETG